MSQGLFTRETLSVRKNDLKGGDSVQSTIQDEYVEKNDNRREESTLILMGDCFVKGKCCEE